MLAKLLLVSVLVFSAHQLMSQTSSTQGFRPISNVYFNEGQIFFTSKDGKNFGHIKKQDGSLTLNWVLSTEQKIMSESEHQIFVSQGQAIAQYSVFEKTQRSVRSLRTGNTTSYAGYQAFKYGFYVFSDGELYLNRWKTIDEGDELISLQIDIDEEFQQMEVFNKLLLIFTVTPDSICFTQVDQSVVKDKKCLSRISSNSVTVKVSGNFLYIIYGGNTQQVLDKDFNVVETFQEEILQLSQGSATFSGFKTFDIESKTLKDWKLVAHNQYGLLNTLELVSGEYILKEGEKQIAKIPDMPNEPVGLWLNKKESAIGRVQGKYELLAQFSTGSLSLYEIRAVQGTISTVVLKWTH